MKNNYGIYVHIPFCKARCGYCAFSSCVNFELQKPYFDVLCNEIEGANTNGVAVKTMFWGGGTPSSASVEYLQKLYYALNRKFCLSELTEFTVECNPESASREMLCFLKSIGVNRLSFGLQSANDSTLKRIGRLHTYQDFLRALELTTELGFENVNADLIVGLPESVAEFEHTVKTVSRLPLMHLSLYALEIHDENKTFKQTCEQFAHSEDELAAMYDFAREQFSLQGFLRYEVSNFAKVGRECKHNLVYWTGNRYFGFGASASGFIENVRYGNAFDILEYIEGGGARRSYEETISDVEQMKEYVMLNLRLQKGFLLSEFSSRFKREFCSEFTKAEQLRQQGFLMFDGGRVFVPDDKFYVLNSILVELLPD